MTQFAVQDALEFFFDHFILPWVVALAILLLLGAGGKAIKPRLARAWAGSALRRRFMAVSKAAMCFVIAVIGNLLMLLYCSPLLVVPAGSGVTPVTLPFMLLLINVATVALCSKLAKQAERPDGAIALQVIVAVLCFTPFLGGVLLMHLIAALRNLTFG